MQPEFKSSGQLRFSGIFSTNLSDFEKFERFEKFETIDVPIPNLINQNKKTNINTDIIDDDVVNMKLYEGI